MAEAIGPPPARQQSQATLLSTAQDRTHFAPLKILNRVEISQINTNSGWSFFYNKCLFSLLML